MELLIGLGWGRIFKSMVCRSVPGTFSHSHNSTFQDHSLSQAGLCVLTAASHHQVLRAEVLLLRTTKGPEAEMSRNNHRLTKKDPHVGIKFPSVIWTFNGLVSARHLCCVSCQQD